MQVLYGDGHFSEYRADKTCGTLTTAIARNGAGGNFLVVETCSDIDDGKERKPKNVKNKKLHGPGGDIYLWDNY